MAAPSAKGMDVGNDISINNIDNNTNINMTNTSNDNTSNANTNNNDNTQLNVYVQELNTVAPRAWTLAPVAVRRRCGIYLFVYLSIYIYLSICI